VLLNMGLNGQGSFGTGYAGAATPAAAGASPSGPTSIGAKAFGIGTGPNGGYPVAHMGLISVGAAALAGLVFIYWSLPR
jgi:hypothetical protein